MHHRGKRRLIYQVFVLAGALLAACNDAVPPSTSGICAPAGRAVAMAWTNATAPLTGPHAVGGAGDYVLANDRAAFVIQGVDRGTTYYHYGGILVDAAAMDGCTQITLDQFEELGILIGTLDLATVYNSVLRAFRAERIEVVRDGSDGGPAHVRATGTDDYYWLVEYTLVGMAVQSDDVRPLSSPFGVRTTIDYILPPDAATLRLVVTFENLTERKLDLLTAAELLFGDRTELERFAAANIGAGGFDFAFAIPWIAVRDVDNPGAYALGIRGANTAAAHVSGVDILFDINQALTRPLKLNGLGATAAIEYVFGVGARDAASAAAALAAYDNDLLQDGSITRLPLDGRVLDTTGVPVTNAVVRLEAKLEDVWMPILSYSTDTEGRFGPTQPRLTVGKAVDYRFVASAPGRLDSPPLTPSDAISTVTLTLPPAGALTTRLRDSDGRVLPTKLSLYQNGVRTHRFFVDRDSTLAVPPGVYEYSLTRGYEYSPIHGTIAVTDTTTVELAAVLERVVDTRGYLSIDTHVHSAPSGDSKVPLDERIRNAAAEGLEVPVATDHEIIVGLQAGLDATGLHDWVATITGEEVTAAMPDHLNMWPVVPEGTRGGPVVWYRKGLPELFDAMRARGAAINMINHPQDLFEFLQWDRVAGTPAIEDYSVLQMTESSAPWSWNFDAIEVMNGFKMIYRTGHEPSYAGLFDNWMSFINHGHRIVAVGVSDAHGLEDLGQPRSYYAANDDLRKFNPNEAVTAFKTGKVLISAGAFARVSINGVSLGGLATDDDGDGIVDVDVTLTALPEIDITHARIYVNCDEAVLFAATASDATVKFAGSIPVVVERDAHIVVAAFGARPMPRGLVDYDPRNMPRVLTNPIYIDADGDGIWTPPGGKECSYTLD